MVDRVHLLLTFGIVIFFYMSGIRTRDAAIWQASEYREETLEFLKAQVGFTVAAVAAAAADAIAGTGAVAKRLLTKRRSRRIQSHHEIRERKVFLFLNDEAPI